jgi:hypothetical protein
MKIEYIPRALAEKFSAVFAGNKTGFSAREISDYFIRYSNLVRHCDFYGFTPTRPDLFIESLYSLEPKFQYYALNDLTFTVYPSKYPYPDEKTREALRKDLHNLISTTPIGLGFSKLIIWETQGTLMKIITLHPLVIVVKGFYASASEIRRTWDTSPCDGTRN